VQADGPYLFRAAFFLVGERALAEDLVQGTFERDYRSWDAERAKRSTGLGRRPPRRA
jgi:DNA-directed RNA polymerase specialized sigma24 family protein